VIRRGNDETDERTIRVEAGHFQTITKWRAGARKTESMLIGGSA
jgi:hypothetical protein